MLRQVIVTFIDLFVTAFNFLILVRIVVSWIWPGRTGGWVGFIIEATEPVLAPVRRLIPPSGLFDWSPLVTFFLLQGLQILAHRLL